MAESPPFIVRAWPADTSEPADDQYADTLTRALSVAHALAFDEQYRVIEVTDERSMQWARFAMLWSCPQALR